MQSTKIKVNQSKEFRTKAAESIVKELCGEVHGSYYVDTNNWKIYFKESNALWNPWADSAVVIPLTDLAPGDIEVTDTVDDWEAALSSTPVALKDILAAYAVATQEEEGGHLEKDGSLAEWVRSAQSEAIEWARQEEWFVGCIQQCEADARYAAISFVAEEILDEVEVDLELTFG